MSGPLSGVRVVEATSAISGPFAGKLLGDMGAEVVKVEPPDTGAADRVRPLPYDLHGTEGFTWRFLNYNTSKESVGIDLKSDEGKAAFERLVESADVVLENMRPGSMERLGLGYDDLQGVNPELVYCSIKGYGDGPYRNRPALDTLIQGISGFATQVGADEEPGTMDVLTIDMTTGLYASWAITMALFERATGDGTGQRVDVSMLDAATSYLGHQLAEYTGGHHHEAYEPRYGAAFAPNGFFATRDGHIALFVTKDHWEGFAATLDRPEWAEDPHPYATNEGRLDHRDDLRADIEAALSDRTTDEWMDYFEEVDHTITAAPVNDIDGMVEDPQVQAQGAVRVRDHPEMGEYWTPNVVPKFSKTPGDLDDAPDLGEDTARLFEELGYDPEEIDALREAGVLD